MAIHRLPGRPAVIMPLQGQRHAVYQVTLSAVPSPVWRAAFIRPPARFGHAPFTPDGIDLQGASVIFQAAPRWCRTGCVGSTAGLPTPTRWWRSERGDLTGGRRPR